MSKLRRAGARWRVLAHEMLPGGESGDSFHIGSAQTGPDTSIETATRTFYSRHTHLPGSDFDELVVGEWIHIEQMDVGVWWMNIGGVTVWVKADRDGRPLSVDVFEPGAYAEPVDGVKYGGAVAPAPAPERPA